MRSFKQAILFTACAFASNASIANAAANHGDLATRTEQQTANDVQQLEITLAKKLLDTDGSNPFEADVVVNPTGRVFPSVCLGQKDLLEAEATVSEEESSDSQYSLGANINYELYNCQTACSEAGQQGGSCVNVALNEESIEALEYGQRAAKCICNEGIESVSEVQTR